MEKSLNTEDEWKNKLTSEQFDICRNKGTEKPFSGEYVHCEKQGVYQCVCCGNALFGSESKYDSGSGWPSFWEALNSEDIRQVVDKSLGRIRVEIVCNACDSHLGHVFEDGPQPTGLRYCVNSVSLELKEKP